MNVHLVGIPDPDILAFDLASNGHWSCEQAEAEGWLVTEHKETRQAVNEILNNWYAQYLAQKQLIQNRSKEIT